MGHPHELIFHDPPQAYVRYFTFGPPPLVASESSRADADSNPDHSWGSIEGVASVAPGTGLRSPETGSKNRGYRGLTRQQRPDLRHLNARKSPQNAGLFVRDLETPVRIGVGGGGCRPPRTGLHGTNSLVNREIYREFRRNRLSAAILASNRRANSMVCNQIPYAMEQGIFWSEQRIFSKETGNFRANCRIVGISKF
jgi:hypothetical protein